MHSTLNPSRTSLAVTHKQIVSTTFHVVVVLTACLLVFSRRPDAILHAQFFAEDGQRWYADAYKSGVRSLSTPDEAGGYLHTAPRLSALLSLLFPLYLAPLVMNLCGIAFQVLPVTIFVSSRFSPIPLWKRLIACIFYLGIPNSYGTNANATNIQWHLGLLACMVLLAGWSPERKWQVFDGIVLALISVESPMGILLIPIAALMWWIRQTRGARIGLALLIPGSIVQAVVVLTSHARQVAPNGASLARFTSILGRQVFLASLLGKTTVLHFALRYSPYKNLLIETTATAMAALVFAYCLRYAPAELKLFIFFSFSALALSLTRPLACAPDRQQWECLRFPGTSNHYFFLPILAFLSALFWIVGYAKSKAVRCFGALLLLVCTIGIRRDWHYPPFEDMHFRQHASEFQAAHVGTRMVIPLNPPPWTMVLTKR